MFLAPNSEQHGGQVGALLLVSAPHAHINIDVEMCHIFSVGTSGLLPARRFLADWVF